MDETSQETETYKAPEEDWGEYSDASIALVSKADPTNVQQIAASQIELLKGNYQVVLAQSRQSFWGAAIAAVAGLILFIGAIVFMLTQSTQNLANLSLISGTMIEFISGINFYLYNKSTSQLSEFHSMLDNTQRFLLANSLCEGLDGEFKQRARSELINRISEINKT